MSFLLRTSTLVFAVLVGLATSAPAAIVYSVNLNGPNEAPPNASLGVGTGTITFDDTLNTMRVAVSFSGLTGTVTNAHIHARTADPFTGTAGVATQTPTFVGFPSGVTAGSYDNTFSMTDIASFNAAYVTANGGTAASAFSALLADAANGRAYLNIHSTSVPAGEIRGFLVAVPEPSGLILSGGLLLTFMLRRQRRIV